MSSNTKALRHRIPNSLSQAALWVFFGIVPLGVVAQPSLPAFDVIRIGVEQGLSHRMVYDIVEDRQGYMWFATREGLNRFDGHDFVVYRHEPRDSLSIPDALIFCVFESSDGTLWIGTKGGLVRFDRSTETFRRVPFRLGDTPQPFFESIVDIGETHDGTLWVVTSLSRLFGLPPNATELELVSITVDGNPGQFSSRKIGVDPTGQILLSCFSAERKEPFLGQVDPASAECSKVQSMPISNPIHAIGFTSDGSVIVGATTLQTGSGSDNVMVKKGNGQVAWSVAIDSKSPMDLLVDKSDQVWLATYSGVFLFDPDGRVIAHLTKSPVDEKTLSSDGVNAIAQSSDGSVWIGTDNGITVFTSRTTPFRAIRHRPGDSTSLGDPRVNAILETSKGVLYVGTSKGLYKRSLGTENFESINLPDMPGVASGAQERIWSLIEAAPGVIWFGTAEGGLNRLDETSGEVQHLPNPFHLIADRNGYSRLLLDRTSIPFIGRDRLGSLWMTTRSEILRVDAPEDFRLVATSTNTSPQVVRLVNVLMQDSRGGFWAGNDLGLWAFNPDSGELSNVGDERSRDGGLSYPMIWTLAESSLTPNAIWVGTFGGGLNRYDLATGLFTWFTMAEGLPSNGIYGLLSDDQGHLWMSTTNGLARFDPLTGSIEQFTQQNGLHDTDFDLLAYHKGQFSGKMWFGGPTGLTEFHPDSIALSAPDFRVNISRVNVLDRPFPGIIGEGDTLRLAHTQNSLGFSFSAPDFLHPNTVGFRYRLTGYDDDWRMNDASRPEAYYTRLPPGWYSFEVQAARTDSTIGKHSTRLVVEIVPAFWQTGWFRFLCIALATGLFGWGVSSVQRRRGRKAIEIAHREVELKRLLAEGEEQERGRLAREIHDGPIQTLYSVNHRLEEASPDGLVTSRRDVQELASELRAICEHLRPSLVDNLGLEGALRTHIRKLSSRYPSLTVSLTFDPTCSDLKEATGHTCYRIVQEALSNVVQHSGASGASIRISRDQSLCSLVITDDGRGFDLPEDWLILAHDSHYGLVGIRERAETLGGSCRITSTKSQGTRIEVDFPMPDHQPVE